MIICAHSMSYGTPSNFMAPHLMASLQNFIAPPNILWHRGPLKREKSRGGGYTKKTYVLEVSFFLPGVQASAPTSLGYTFFRVRRVTFFLRNRVEHQKLNQTTPYGAVWLSFWCSTRPSAHGRH